MPLTGPVPEGGTFFCRSNVFGDAFAASQERRQYCEMRSLQANDGRAGQGSSLSSFIGPKMP